MWAAGRVTVERAHGALGKTAAAWRRPVAELIQVKLAVEFSCGSTRTRELELRYATLSLYCVAKSTVCRLQ